MFLRLSFWIGLLLGASSAFGLRRRWLPAPAERNPNPLLDLVSDAVVVCDASGAVTYANAVAHALFGPDGRGSFELAYLSRQRVPPGQVPLTRALRTEQVVEGAGYRCAAPDGATHVLDVSARPLTGGGAAAVFRDVTALHEALAREGEAERQAQILNQFGRRLSAATDAGALCLSVVESALALLEGLPEARARLYWHDAERRQLTRVAAAPEEAPKRPRSHRQALPPTFPFEATVPLLWQVYVARQAFVSADLALDDRFLVQPLGEERAGSACALPLLAGSAALGHLSLTCRMIGAFTERRLVGLEVLASTAALGLAGQRHAAEAAHFADQMTALRGITQAVSDGQAANRLADLVAGEVQRVLGVALCTLATWDGEGVRLRGEAYKDALLFPERHTPDDPALTHAETRLGIPNPAFETGPWRAFAGQSGTHSVLSAPLAAGQGALTVYAAGDAPFTGAQVRFLETLASLLSAAFPPATPPAERGNS